VILVAGGTGLLGSRVVKVLTDAGEQVRVMTRDPRRASHLPAGVEVVVGDVRRGPLDTAVQGCDRVVSAVHGFAGPQRTSPAAVDRDGNRSLIAAAKRAGVDRFVLVSIVGARADHPMSLHRMKYAAEQELRASGLTAAIVRSTSFLETWIEIIGAKVGHGGPALVLGPGQNPINFVSVADVAAFVALAVHADQRIGDGVSVGGPQNLGFTEIAAHLLARKGRTDRPKQVPLTALKAMSVIARPLRPGFARQARAAVVMNTTDMTFDALPVRNRFPDIPATTLAQVTHAMTSEAAP
jgi:NADH dehydrogenase